MEIEPQDMFETALQSFNPKDAIIAEMRKQFLVLKVDGVEDKEGFKEVREALKVMVGERTSIERTRVGLKAGALEYGRRIDSEASRLKDLMAPIETHLKKEVGTHKLAVQAIKDEKEAEKLRVLRERMAALGSVETVYPSTMVEAMSDAGFAAALHDATEAHVVRVAERDAAVAKKKAEDAKADAERKAEGERLLAERKAFEAERLAEDARIAAVAKVEEDRIAKVAADATAELAEDRRQFEEDKAAREDAAAKERAELHAKKVEFDLAKANAEALVAAKEEAKAAKKQAKKEAAETKAVAECAPWMMDYLGEVQSIMIPDCPFRDEVVRLREVFLQAVASHLPEEVSK